MGMAYDVFGDGKTAIKVNVSKYFQSAANDGVYIGANKASTFAQTATALVDGQRQLHSRLRSESPAVQDNRAAGGDFCGAADNSNFFQFAQTTARHGNGCQPGSSAAGTCVRTTGSSRRQCSSR